MSPDHVLVPILACSDFDASTKFYAHLGFRIRTDYPLNYRILADSEGAELHLAAVAKGDLDPKRNAFGVYFYTNEVDRLAAQFAGDVVHAPENKPWGMYEFAVSDPDGTLVRVGMPTAKQS